ncbi:MAG: hypothetical protein F2855_01070 [Actinobacteria bacterium]|uniref:histidine kinase n=1 Tax=freshwater metagenome TaxID=449393 RepID=A0A6J6CJE4_9ZZZZ|nr:hypothetical protein [Actinomycetota bacterium]MSX99781.1 hypothetical protein [Actinomycetota bacterium]MTA91187.1 hypothetical protein [Actinomycetota bacterium]
MSTPTRLELARDLHDGIAQDLVALGYELDLLLGKSDSTLQSRLEIRTLRFRVDELISKVRREMYELRDPKVRTLQEELAAIASEICGELLGEFELDTFDIPITVQSELKLIAIELLRNAKMHSRASQIELTLRTLENRTYLEVRDNGVGGAKVDMSRLGLVGVKERINALNGNLEISTNEKGTSIKVFL